MTFGDVTNTARGDGNGDGYKYGDEDEAGDEYRGDGDGVKTEADTGLMVTLTVGCPTPVLSRSHGRVK